MSRCVKSPDYLFVSLFRPAANKTQVQFIDASHQNYKSRYFLYGMNNTFLCVDLSLFDQSYSGGITTTKSLPDIGGTTKMSAAWLPWDSPWSLASTPWAMSLYFKFRAIYFWLLNEYQWWDEAKVYHIIRKLSHRFMCEIMIWSGDKTKLIRKKHFHKTTITSSKT